MDIQNKVIVITGASDGLGRAIAIRLAQEKVKLVILARNEGKLKSLKEEIQKTGAEIEYYVCDIMQVEQIQAAIKNAVDKFGTVDILINNAGIWFPDFVDKQPIEQIQNLFATNTLGSIYATREVLPIMKAKKSGQIYNVISIAGIETNPNYGEIYTATKHALSGFYKALSEEVKTQGIKISNFYPGGMATNIFAHTNQTIDKSYLMDTKDIAEIVVFTLKQPHDVIIDHLEARKFI